MSSGITNNILQPSAKTSFLVRKFIFLKATESVKEKIIDKHIPDGSSSIIFNFSGNIGLMEAGGINELSSCFLTIPHLGHTKLITVPPAETFIVVCKTSVFSRLFNLNMESSQPPSYIDLEKIIPHLFWKNMFEEKSMAKRVDLFEKYILQIQDGKNYKPDKIDKAYDYIYANAGLLPIHDIADGININNRSLRRNFKSRVGLSPKSFSRIVRFSFLWKRAIGQPHIDFQQLAYAGNFFDQSHFIRDFKIITGECPHKFFGRDLEKVKLLSGIPLSLI